MARSENNNWQLDATRPPTAEWRGDASKSLTNRRILVVDDNPTNRKLLRVLLEAEAHTVLEADNGIAALNVLEQGPVDAVISDILMPEMDGYRLCYEIRKSQKFNHVPFIVYTASYTLPSDEKLALQFGVDKFIRKPAAPGDIVNSLYEVLATADTRQCNGIEQPEEAEVMREYSQALVRKLEQTIVDLSEANRNLAERTALAEFVATVSNALSAASGLREMLQRCCDAMVSHLDAAFARIWTFNEKENILELQASSGVYKHIDGGHARIAAGQFDIGLIASQRAPLLTNSVIGDSRVHDQEWARREGMVAFAGYPLMMSDQLVGVTAVFARKALSQNSLEVMGTVAQNIAVGIQRRVSECELRRSEERFRELAENVNEIFFVADPNGGPVHYVSPAHEEITSQRRELLYQNPHAWLEIIHPDDRPRVEQAFSDHSDNLDQEYRIVRPDGGIRWLRARSFPVKDESGNVLRVVGVAADLTERKQAEEKVNQNLNRIRALHEIDTAISSVLDLRTVLNVLLEKIEIFLPIAAASTVRLLNPDSGGLESLACRGLDVEEWRSQQQLTPGGRAGRVVETKTPVAVRDIQGDARSYNPGIFNKHGLVSYLGVPLIAKEKVLGVLSLYTNQDHVFGDEEVEFLVTLAGQAAIAIHNAQLHEQTERQLKRIEALREIDKAITSTLDLGTVLNVLLQKLDLFFSYPSVATVRLFDKARGRLEPAAARNMELEVWVTEMQGVQPDARSYGRVVIEKKAPLIILNLQTDPRTQHPDFYCEHDLISYAGIPLMAKDEVLGVLGIYTKEEHHFSDEELELLKTLAGQAAIAIHNAKLFEEVVLSKKELENTNRFLDRSLTQLGGLYTAMTPLAVSESLVEMIDGIVARLMGATGADAALIRIRDRSADNQPVIAQRGYTQEFIDGIRPERTAGAVHWVIENNEPIIAHDIASDLRLLGKRQLKMSYNSCAILPLRVRDQIRGVIQLSSRRLGYFDNEQREHLLAIARQMSVALENRELFYNLQRSRNQLERANKVKDEFLSVISHELRTPLSIVTGYSTLLGHEQLGPMTRDQKQALNVIQRNSQELLAMIESIMDATKIEAGSMRAEMAPVPLSQMLSEIKAAYESAMTKHLNLEWDFSEKLPQLWTDERKLRQIITNLINNAIKFTDAGTVMVSAREKLEATSSGEQRSIEFRVIDSGVGIPPEKSEKIFERFYQVDSSQSRSFEGAGLGLYIVKSFAELLGGRVSVCSEVGKGSAFTVSLPVRQAD